MLTYCVRRYVARHDRSLKIITCRAALALRHSRGRCSSVASHAVSEDSDHIQTLVQICKDRYYIATAQPYTDAIQRGVNCSFGPLGTELRKNLLDQWWHSVTRSKTQIFGISTLLSSSRERATEDGELRIVSTERLKTQEVTGNHQPLGLQTLLHNSAAVRTSILQGALEQYIPSLDLVNRKLPFGLAETGLCFQTNGPGCPLSEVTQTSLTWFCPPRTSSQWLDHWARQRLQWWKKFALSPSDFSCSDIPEEEQSGKACRGVKIIYKFPWGPEPLETLWNRGDAELLQANKGLRAKLQCRDGRKLVLPHVVSVTGNMDRGVIAYLCNSLQQVKKANGKQKLQQRKVLKLHPVLAPVKVALDMGRAATVELREVCEGLLQEFQEAEISAWPGYLYTTSTSQEQLNSKYDEMGVLFTVVISDSTLETGLLQVRSRDTTVKETMHISEVKAFLTRHISAAKKI